MTPETHHFYRAAGRSREGVDRWQAEAQAYFAHMRAVATEVGANPEKCYTRGTPYWCAFVQVADTIPAGMRRVKGAHNGIWPDKRTAEGKAILAKIAAAPKIGDLDKAIGAVPGGAFEVTGDAGPGGGMFVADGRYDLHYVGADAILTTRKGRDGRVVGTPPLDAEPITGSAYYLLKEAAQSAKVPE